MKLQEFGSETLTRCKETGVGRKHKARRQAVPTSSVDSASAVEWPLVIRPGSLIAQKQQSEIIGVLIFLNGLFVFYANQKM